MLTQNKLSGHQTPSRASPNLRQLRANLLAAWRSLKVRNDFWPPFAKPETGRLLKGHKTSPRMLGVIHQRGVDRESGAVSAQILFISLWLAIALPRRASLQITEELLIIFLSHKCTHLKLHVPFFRVRGAAPLMLEASWLQFEVAFCRVPDFWCGLCSHWPGGACRLHLTSWLRFHSDLRKYWTSCDYHQRHALKSRKFSFSLLMTKKGGQKLQWEVG